jgi:hypothetical protein
MTRPARAFSTPTKAATDAARTGRSQACASSFRAWFGATIFSQPIDVPVQLSQPWFVPASMVNALAPRGAQRRWKPPVRAARHLCACRAPPRWSHPPPYPEDTLSFLGNVFNHKAHDFYVRHGVKVIAAAYEAHEEEGEVSLMITKHCVRYSMSLCPKQAKGVTGVQGTIRAEPLTTDQWQGKAGLCASIASLARCMSSARCGAMCWTRPVPPR